MQQPRSNRAGEGIRTLDVTLGNLTIPRTSAGVHDNTNSRVVDPLIATAESRGLAVTYTRRDSELVNTDRIALFQFAFKNVNDRGTYERLKEEAEALTQREQLQVVNDAIMARFRIEGGEA